MSGSRILPSLTAIFLAGCGSQAIDSRAGALIEDAVHNDGRAGFYFLPPLVEATPLPPVFDGSLSLHAELEEPGGAVLATVALTAGIDLYQGKLDTDGLDLDSATTYRLRVMAGADLLGFADVRVFLSQKAAKSLATDESFELVDGGKLQVKVYVNGCATARCAAATACRAAETCDPSTGACLPGAAVPDGKSCGDGNGCNGAETCQAGVCVPGTAPFGFADSDGTPATCETNLNSDVNNCGSCLVECRFPNGAASCNSGTCRLGVCNAGFGNCDFNSGNGCETNLNSDVNNCGSCLVECRFPNGAASCNSGTCRLGVCNTGFGNCDGNVPNGCEVNLNSDVNNCGSCLVECRFPNGAASCNSGTCRLGVCNAGFGNCDGNVPNGCEVNLNSDVNNCGSCLVECGAGSVCISGRCELACGQGLVNCNGACVNLSSDNDHCGVCGQACPAGSACTLGQCALACGQGFVNCSGACVDLSSDNDHCGVCGNACLAGKVCTLGQCGLACGQGLSNCNNEACVDLSSDDKNCGVCGHACPAGSTCTSGQCAGCGQGLVNCNGKCASLSSDNDNCGACGQACPAGSTCTSGQCVCGQGLVTCGGACVNLSSDNKHCGACGHACPAGTACTLGQCA